jgi:hypothetical protein
MEFVGDIRASMYGEPLKITVCVHAYDTELP